MSAEIIDFFEATQPPQTFDVQTRIVRRRGQEFTVETVLDTATRRGVQKVTCVKRGELIAAYGFGDGDATKIAEIAVQAWLNGHYLGAMEGRAALIDEIHDPRYQ